MSGNFTKNSKTKARGVLARQGCSAHGCSGKKCKVNRRRLIRDDFLTHDKQLLLSGCAHFDSLFLSFFILLAFVFVFLPLRIKCEAFSGKGPFDLLIFYVDLTLYPGDFVLFGGWWMVDFVFQNIDKESGEA